MGQGAPPCPIYQRPVGEVLSATGTMAAVNPLRYRGYYYDAETGLYYLQSRYYDPALKRFLNADGLASTGQGILGTNMFAYCGNDPVAFCDPRGHSLVLVPLEGDGQHVDVFIYYHHPQSEKNMDQFAMAQAYSENALFFPVQSFQDLLLSFNDIPSYTNNVYLYLHGDDYSLIFFYNLHFTEENVKNHIPEIDISGDIYLFSCHGGKTIAPALSSATGERVHASNEGVSFTDGFARCGFKDYIQSSFNASNRPGWYLYYPSGYVIFENYLYCYGSLQTGKSRLP